MKMVEFLNQPPQRLLSAKPFCNWSYEKTNCEIDSNVTHYVFPKGLELRSDEISGNISVIFLFMDKLPLEPSDLGWGGNRTEIRNLLNTPTACSSGSHVSGLGEISPWDRYEFEDYVIRFGYGSSGEILEITYMRSELDPIGQKIITYIPSLVATLLNKENGKGSSLTQLELEEIRNRAPKKELSIEELEAVEERRGYKDINPDDLWCEWRSVRKYLKGSAGK